MSNNLKHIFIIAVLTALSTLIATFFLTQWMANAFNSPTLPPPGGSGIFGVDASDPAYLRLAVASSGVLNERFEVAGAIKIGQVKATGAQIQNGTIRYTGTDFEGRKGGTWVSLTGEAGAAGGWTRDTSGANPFIKLTTPTDRVFVGPMSPYEEKQIPFEIRTTMNASEGSNPSLKITNVGSSPDQSADIQLYASSTSSGLTGWWTISVDDKSEFRLFRLGTSDTDRNSVVYITNQGFFGIAGQATNHEAFYNLPSQKPQSALHIVDSRLSATTKAVNYLQIDTLTAAPPAADCNAAEEAGRMKFDATGDNFYICSGASGWRKITTVAP